MIESQDFDPAGNYMFKVNNKDTKTVLIVNFEHVSHLALVFLLFIVNR